MGNAVMLVGERGSGKSYLVRLYAVTEAYKGGEVLFQCRSVDQMDVELTRCERVAADLELRLSRMTRSHGHSAMYFPSGGSVRFVSTLMRHWRGLRRVDLHIVDDCLGEGHPDAARVVKTAQL